MRKKFITILCLLTLISVGCAQKKKIEPLPSSSPEAPPAIPDVPPPSPQTTGPQREFKLEKKEPEIREKVILNKTGSNYIFLTAKTAPIMPIDFKIGTLQNTKISGGDEKAITDQITTLLDGFKKKSIIKSSLSQDGVAKISSYLDYHISLGNLPEEYRIGKINITGSDSAQANLRLLNKTGRAEGEIYLNKFSGKWYISDLQIGLETMTIEYDPGDSLYSPATYHWILKEK